VSRSSSMCIAICESDVKALGSAYVFLGSRVMASCPLNAPHERSTAQKKLETLHSNLSKLHGNDVQ
jgi:hypothetical protein